MYITISLLSSWACFKFPELEVQQLENSYGDPVADGHMCFDDNSMEGTPNARVICESTGCGATLTTTWRLNGVTVPAPGTQTDTPHPDSAFTTISTFDLVFTNAYDGQILTCYADETTPCEESTSVTIHGE